MSPQPARSDIEAIFDTVSRLPLQAQEAALAHACDGDAALIARLRGMLADTGAGLRLQGDAISERVEDWTRRRDAETAAFWKDQRIGDFSVRDLLGQGGMGVVVSARRDGADEDVALKLVRPDLISSGLIRRLQREHDALARLDHPGIARLYGLHVRSDGAPFIEMEKIDGTALDVHVADLDLAARIGLLENIARVAGHAHARGVVHRDLKPANVLVTADGKVKLLDFGIAKTIEEESLATMTATGERLLTPRYAAPEQLLGGIASPATDVFALGVMLCELALGNVAPRAPTSAHTMNATSALGARIAAPGDPRLRRIAERALQNDPALRYADGDELADELQRWQRGEWPHAGGWRDRLRRQWRSVRVRALIAVGVCVLAATAAFAVHRHQQARVIDIGYGFIERDLAGLDGDARTQTRRALQLDAGGARETALGLVLTARRDAPDHPLLTFLDLTWNDVDASEAATRLLAAEAALVEHPNIYLQTLLTAEVRADTGAALRSRLLNTALQMRPQAWRLRLALAHGEISSGRLDSALHQLQRIDIRNLRDRRAAQILADRALLGDSAGARAAIDALPADHPAWREWVLATIEFSEGDYAAARQRFAALNTPAIEQDEPTIAMWGRLGQMICLGQTGDWSGLIELAATDLRRARERGEPSNVLRSALMGAIAAHQTQDRARRAYFLQAARNASAEPLSRMDVALTTMALGEAVGDIDALIASLPAQSESLAGLPALLRAAQAVHTGDRAQAQTLLQQAHIEGVDATRLGELARWYGARVQSDAAYQAPTTNLWFAPWSNWIAAWLPPIDAPLPKISADGSASADQPVSVDQH